MLKTEFRLYQDQGARKIFLRIYYSSTTARCVTLQARNIAKRKIKKGKKLDEAFWA
jgi:hypothetical protein